MKRKRLNGKSSGGSVTGGTGDIKPQILTITSGAAPAAAQYVSASTALPVPRFGARAGKATIFEFLWVDWYLNVADFGDTVNDAWGWLSTAATRANGVSSTLATLNADILDPRAFALAIVNKTLTTSGSTSTTYPIRVDLTDSNGNGYLVATDKLVISNGSVGNTAVGEAVAKVAYRLVDVGIDEYVGIVQSQTGIA